jgi:hypothetical protein
LTFIGNGNSITAPSQTAGGLLDAVFNIIGGDYITWNGFSINAGAGSTTGSTTNDKTEFGFAFLALSATDGCQNNTVQNCSIDMGTTPYQNQFGVYFSNSHSTTAITTSQAAASISGSNSNNKIIGNAITGAPIGVLFLSGPITATNAQTGNEVNNNAITVVGCPAAISGYSSFTTTAHSAGIEFRNCLTGVQCNGNKITASTSTITNPLDGILGTSGTDPVGVSESNQFRNDTITFTSAVASGFFTGIRFSPNLNTINQYVSNNIINLTATSAVANSYQYHGLVLSGTQKSAICTNNIVNMTMNQSAGTTSSGQITPINMGGSGLTNGFDTTMISNNVITIKQFSTSGGLYTNGFTGLIASSATGYCFIVNNILTTGIDTLRTNFSNNSVSNGIQKSVNISEKIEVNNNQILLNCSHGTVTTVLNIMTLTGTSPVNQSFNCNNNKIKVYSSSSAIGLNITDGAATTIATRNIKNNKIDLVSNRNVGTVAVTTTAINVSAGNTTVLDNDTIPRVIISGTSGTSIGTATGIQVGSLSNANASCFMNNNIVDSIWVKCSGSTPSHVVRGIVNTGATGSGSNYIIRNNKIRGLGVENTSGNSIVYGIFNSGTAPNTVLANNLITDLSNLSTGATAINHGISYTGVSISDTVYNNIISNLTGAGNAPNGIIGLAFTSANNHVVYNNTINLAGLSSTQTNFGATGVLFPNASGDLLLRNNIIKLAGTPKGTGTFSALRVAAGTASTAPTNYNPLSNNNIYYSPTIPFSYLYSEGVTNTTITDSFNLSNDASFNQACGGYKQFLGGKDNKSTTENTSFSSPSNGMFIPTGTSYAESGAAVVNGYNLDYNGATRAAISDIGAIEFNGTAPTDITGPSISYTNIDNLNCVIAPTLSVSIADVSGINTSSFKPRLYYKYSTNTNDSGANNSSGTGWKWVETTSASSPYSFTFDYSKLTSTPTTGDVLQYFIVAQDNASTTNVGNNIVFYAAGYCPSSVALRQAGFPVSGFKSFSFQSPTIDIFASPMVVCQNNNDTIRTTLSRLEDVTIGAVTLTQASISPYNTTVVGAGRRQISIYRAAELQAQGIGAGNITAISYTVATSTSTLTLPDFTIKMGYHATNSTTVVAGTIASNLASGGMTTVIDYSVSPLSGYTPSVGVNAHNFTTPFYWDGVSNIVVETCMSSPSSTTLSTHAVNYTNLGTITLYNTAAGSNCGFTGTGTVNAFRPVAIFRGTKSVTTGLNYVWKQAGTNLGVNNDTIIVQPIFPGASTTIKYDVAVSDQSSCTFYDTVELTKNTSTPSLTSASISTTTPCFGDSLQLFSSVTGGCPPYTTTYKIASTLGGTASIINLSSTKKFKPILQKGYISVTIVDNASNTINAFVDSFVLPPLPTVVHDTICGTGNAVLNASTTAPNIIYWYSKSGTYLDTGNTFTTPVISTTDTFFAKSVSAGGANTNLITSATPAGPWTSTNGTGGIMFDLTPSVNITIDSFLARTNTTTATQAVSVYWKTGTHNGFQTNSAPWTLYSGSTITAPYTANATTGGYLEIDLPGSGLSLQAGQTYGIYIAYVSAYINATTAGTPNVYSNSDLTFTSGSTSGTAASPFSSTIADRVFTGKIIYSSICASDGVPVFARVTSPPPFSTNYTAPIQICNPTTNQSTDSIKITSALSNYNSYTWSPTSVSGSSSLGWALSSINNKQDTFTLTAFNTGSGCQQIAKIYVNPVPYSVTKSTTVNLANHCLTGTSVLTLTGSPTLGATYQWQSSPNGTTWTNIAGANSTVCNTGAINSTTNYRAIINCNGSPIGASISPSQTINVTVQNPAIDSVKHDTICGVKTATLRAYTPAPNKIQWYTKTGVFLDTGIQLVTPILSQTDTFIAKSVTAPGVATSLFTTPTPTGTWTTNNGSNGLMFDLTPNVNINLDSILGRTTTTTTQNVNVYYKTGTYSGFETNASAWTLFSGASISSPYIANNGGYVEIALPNGGLQLQAGQTYGIFVSYTAQYVTGIASPPNNLYSNADLSFVGGAATAATFATTIANRVFTGKLVYKTGCASAGTPVIAKVNNPPALTFANDFDSICKGQSTALKTLSAGGGTTYSSYAWSSIPATALPPVGNIAGSGVRFIDTTPGLVKYILTGNQSSGSLCKNIDTFYLKVKSIPEPFSIIVSGPTSFCNGTTTQLQANSGYSSNSKIGTATTTGTAAYYNPFYSTFENEKSHYLFTAAELNAAGFQAGNIDSIAFYVTNQAMTYDITSFTVRMAHTTNTNLSAGFGTPTSSFTTVFPAANIGKPAVGMFKLPFTTPFAWDGTSNLLIELCKDNDVSNSGTFWGGSMAVEFTAYSSAYTYGSYGDNVSQCSVGGGTNANSLNRPNIHFWANTQSPITWSAIAGLYSYINCLIYWDSARYSLGKAFGYDQIFRNS